MQHIVSYTIIIPFSLNQLYKGNLSVLIYAIRKDLVEQIGNPLGLLGQHLLRF